MDIYSGSNLVGFGVTNIDVYNVRPDGFPEDELRVRCSDLMALVAARGIKVGDKYSCTSVAEFDLFQRAFDKFPHVRSPGGSLFNTFCGIGASQCGFNPILYTYAGVEESARQIRAATARNGVVLCEIPQPKDFTGPLDIPTNLVLVPVGADDRMIIKGPNEVVRKAFGQFGIPDKVVQNADAIFVQGASIIRLGWGVFHAVRKHRRKDSLLIFTLPTVEKYPKGFRKALLQSFVYDDVSVLSSTKEEFSALFGRDYEKGLHNLLAAWDKTPLLLGEKPRTALITDGKNGAKLVVQGRGIFDIKARANVIPAHKVGAGDATIAGYIAGLKAGLDPLVAADNAMNFGALKTAQREKSSVIRDPLVGLKKLGSVSAQAYFAAIRPDTTGQSTEIKAARP